MIEKSQFLQSINVDKLLPELANAMMLIANDVSYERGVTPEDVFNSIVDRLADSKK